jgi:hypothetical protein
MTWAVLGASWTGFFTKTGRLLLREETRFETASELANHEFVYGVEYGVTEDGIPKSFIQRKGGTLNVTNAGAEAVNSVSCGRLTLHLSCVAQSMSVD